MSDLTLVIGNRNYSSWSLRAWLAAEQTGAPFATEQVWFDEDRDRRRRLSFGPTGKVPVLIHGTVVVWDSLAIGEYLAECFPEAGLWPHDQVARARARALCAEMHAGFPAIRERLSMNIRASRPHRDRGPEVAAEVERVVAIWTDTRREFGKGGPYLFGTRTLADAFYAPVVTRFRTYNVPLDGAAAAYAAAVVELPAMQDWMSRAASEGHPSAVYDGIA